MNNPNMLYRCPGLDVFEGVACETTVVEAEEVEAKLAEGWSVNWVQAHQVAQDAAAAQIAANEAEQARIAEELAKAGGDTAADLVGDAPADPPADEPKPRGRKAK